MRSKRAKLTKSGQRAVSSRLGADASLVGAARSALTLIELLVVIIILTTIVAAAIPIMSPSNDDRRIREATRGLNTFITGAQARAIARGRPYGIQLKRLSADTGRASPGDIDNDNGVCLEVFYVEQPPPFAGFDPSSAVRITRNPQSDGGLAVQFVRRSDPRVEVPPGSDGLPEGLDKDLPPNVIRRGDILEVGGSRFEITDTDVDANGFYQSTSGKPDGELWIRPHNPSGQLGNFVHRDPDTQAAERRYLMWTLPLRYKILRQPTRTSDEPYQLPEGTAIDLRASGVGSKQFFFNMDPNNSELRVDNPFDVTIMFAPEGRIAHVAYSLLADRDKEVETFDEPVVDNVFLLVGRSASIQAPRGANDPTLAQLPPPTSPGIDEKLQELREPINWLNGTSRWVVIGAQSGRVVSVENGFVDLYAVNNLGGDAGDRRNQQILAAREFTREMSQMGGR
jgi:type II secretory pathway pseudopilin PulG